MEREQLARTVREPSKVGREDLVGLKAMAERYPWFSGAHLLLAVGEHASGDVLYDDTLARAAAHIPSREVLFNLTEEAAADRSGTVSPTAATARPTVPATPPLPHTVEEPATPEPITTPQGTPAAEATAVEPATTEEVRTDDRTVGAEEDILERQILEAALSSAYDLTWRESLHTPPHEVPAPPANTPAPPPGEPLPPHVAEKAPEPVTAKEQQPNVTRASRLRFTDWLSVEPGPEATPAPVLPAPSPAAQGTAAEVPPPRAAAPPAPADPQALIDRFIQQDAPPPPPKATFFTPQQAAKRSLDDQSGLVTETLARIYEKQGNLVKAIDAYRRLALKHPEKSAYFAALQKKLEEQSNK